jgi:type IV pilus assembly protein PilP
VTRVLVLSLLTVLLAGEVGFAQSPQAAAPAPAAPVAAASSASSTTPPAQGPAAEKKSDAVEPQGFTYNPEGRRDPFVSLLRRGASATETKRVTGLAGLGTAEVSLRGTLKSNGAFVGILKGVDNKTYIVRAGDKLSDGAIRSITADAMVILQQVTDPLSLAKEQEVRKLLRQTEEGK